MTASMTSLPVIGVPVPLQQLDGLDSLLSIVQMPDGIPVATVGVGKARNAGLLAVRILGAHDDALRARSSTTTAPRSTRRCGRRTAAAHSGLKTGLRFSTNAATPSIPSGVPDAAGDRLGLAGEVRLERVLEAGVEQSLGRARAPCGGPAASLVASAAAAVLQLVVGHDLGDEAPVERLVGARAPGW